MKPNDLILPPYDAEKHHATWQDIIGRIYAAGQIVAYAATCGRSAGLTVGMVKRINAVDSKGERLETKQYNRTTHNYDDPIPTATVTIAPLVDSANRWRYTNRDITVSWEKVVRLDIGLGDIMVEMING